MLGHIRDVIGEKCRVINESFNVDEERQLIAFEANDLATIIRETIQVCADCCMEENSRQEILKLLD